MKEIPLSGQRSHRQRPNDKYRLSIPTFLVFLTALCSSVYPQAFSVPPGNFVKVTSGGNGSELNTTIITVKVPYFSNAETLYPNLNEFQQEHDHFLADSNGKKVEIDEEEIEEVQRELNNTSTHHNTSVLNTTTITTTSSPIYLNRSVRSYPVGGFGGQYNPTQFYNRQGSRYYDNRRHFMDTSDGPSASSSWGGKWFNQLKRRMNPMSSGYDRQQMMVGQDMATAEEPEMSGTFLHGGWGHQGWKGGVNKSAVGLLGFLSLLSLIQNVLNQTQSAPAPAPAARGVRRGKRDIPALPFAVVHSQKNYNDYSHYHDTDYGYSWERSLAETNLIVPLILPMLNAVNYAQNGMIPVECTFQPICLANHVLVEKLGERGSMVGKILSEIFSRTLKRAAWRWKSNGLDISGKVVRAGMSGRNGKDCRVLFTRDCEDDVAHFQQYSPETIALLLGGQIYP